MRCDAQIMMKCAQRVLLTAITLGATACGNTTQDAISAHNPTVASNPPVAASAPLTDSPLPTAGFSILSVLSVEHQVDVSSERDGVVVSIAVDEGSAVMAGETLGQLDDRTVQMELVKARDDLEVSHNNVKYKEAELKAKTAVYLREQQLSARGLTSEANLEVAEFEAKGAEFDLHGSEALIESGQAAIHQIEIQIDQTRLRAPFSGVIVHRYVRQGQAVAKGDKCFRISQLGPLQVQFQVPESSGRRPEIGAAVNLALVGFSNRSLLARLVKVSPTVDPASDSYNVTAQLIGSGLADLRPGMAVRVEWSASAPPKPK